MFAIRTKFYQFKVTTMMKRYDQSVDINHNSNWPYIPDILIESSLLAIWDLGKLMSY